MYVYKKKLLPRSQHFTYQLPRTVYLLDWGKKGTVDAGTAGTGVTMKVSQNKNYNSNTSHSKFIKNKISQFKSKKVLDEHQE